MRLSIALVLVTTLAGCASDGIVERVYDTPEKRAAAEANMRRSLSTSVYRDVDCKAYSNFKFCSPPAK